MPNIITKPEHRPENKPETIWSPARWTCAPTEVVPYIQLGHVIRNPVYQSDCERTRKLAETLDTLLAARGLRIDHTNTLIGFVVEL